MSHKRFSSRLLLVLCFVSGLGTLEAAQFKRGDSDSDGQITIGDVAHTLCYLFLAGATPQCLDAADFNNSGQISISDSVATLAFLFLNGPPSPAPGPFTCGNGANVLGCVTPPPCSPITPPSLNGLAFQFQTQPPTVGGPTGSWVCIEHTAQILNNTAIGIGGWSMNIVRQGPMRILSVTTSGTAVPTYFSGGFQKSEVTSCGNAATSAVVLSFMGGTSLPPSAAPYDVLRLKVMRRINNASCTLSYQGGQKCNGQPVANIASETCGSAYLPSLIPTTVNAIVGGGPNTPAGTNVEVCLNPSVWVTFGQLNSPQNTTAVLINPNNANFKVTGMAQGWQLGPAGSYPGGVTVNIRYPCSWPLPMAQSAVLLHNNVPIPGQVNNTCTRVITGFVTSFSEFSIAVDPTYVKFLRGDSNGDGRVDVSDAIHALGCQFLGTACSSCPDAADSNDDGSVDIGDAVHILNFQFQGGSWPPAPGPVTAGEDPTPDGLDACSYVERIDPDEVPPCDDPEGECF